MTLPGVITLRTGRVSRLPLHWRGDAFALTAVGGQAGTMTRTTTATPADSNGTTRTVVHSQPAWQIEDWDGDAVRDSATLLTGGTGWTAWWPYLAKPTELTLFVEFVERGCVAVASAAVAYIGNAGNSGARLWIDSTGTFYRANHHNGTSSVTSTLAAAPSAGNRVTLRVTLAATGAVQIHQSINGAAESSASASGTLTLGAAWSDTRLYLGSTGTTNIGASAIRSVRVAHGTYTAAQMQVAW